MRLDAFLAQKEKISRTKCKELILAGRVKVEGSVALKPSLSLEAGKKSRWKPEKPSSPGEPSSSRRPWRSFPPRASKSKGGSAST